MVITCWGYTFGPSHTIYRNLFVLLASLMNTSIICYERISIKRLLDCQLQNKANAFSADMGLSVPEPVPADCKDNSGEEWPTIVAHLNCSWPTDEWACQVTERLPDCNGKWVSSPMENTCFTKTWLYQLFLWLPTEPLNSETFIISPSFTPNLCLYPLITRA